MNKLSALITTTFLTTSLISGVSYAATATVGASAVFVTPLALSSTQDLYFGTHTTDISTTATIAVSISGVITASDTGAYLNDAGTNGVVEVIGESGLDVTISVSENVAADFYTMDTFTCKYDSGTETACSGAGYTQTLGASGSEILIGATANMNAAPTSGTDSGSVTVTVTYN